MSDSVGPAPGAGPGHQARVDAMVEQVRREGGEARRPLFKPPPPRPGPSTDPLDHRIAEELDYLRRHLDLLGEALANDVALLRRYPQQLQAIDFVNQILGHLGQIISAGDKSLAVEQLSHPELRNRLKRKAL